MANTFITSQNAPGIIAKMAAEMLKDELQFCKSIAKAPEEDYNGKNGYGAGNTIFISKPPRYIPQNTFDITSSIQDIVEEKTPLTLDVISTVGVDIDTLEFATEIELKNTMERVIKPAISSIAQDVETQFIEKSTDATYNLVGTAGSTTFDTDTILSAREKMNQYLCPKDNERYFLFDSAAGRKAVNERKGLFQSSEEISKQYKSGLIGIADGFMWLENELLSSHLNGNDVTFEVSTTVTTEGSTSLVVEGLTATTGTVTKGTVFTVDTVFAVHPITKRAYNFLQSFVVTADVTADGAGLATLAVSPAMYTAASNGLQNITAFPADGDTCNVLTGTASTAYTQNLAFHKEAFRMVSVPLVMPTKAEFAAQATEDGITVAIVRDWDQLTRKMVTRLDFLGGIAAVREEWACRITS